MQFLFNDDSNLYSSAGSDDDTTLPSNVKQMGSIEEGIRIYVEDYVYTYLYQYARSGGNKEKLAALAGKHMTVQGQEVIMISGAIQAKDTKQERVQKVLQRIHGDISMDRWRYILKNYLWWDGYIHNLVLGHF